MQYSVKNSLDYREGQCSFFFTYDSIYAWDVANAWLISLSSVSDCRKMEGPRISNMRRHGKHSGCRTEKAHHAWRDGCNGTRHSAIEHLFHGIRS
jgi:hypothetical protein